MTAPQWERVKQTTADALERSPVARTDFVNSACADDQQVLREVLRLVAEAEASGDGFLSDPPWNLRGVLDHQIRQVASFSAGQMVSGRFRIDRFLNRGGMGEVYSAFDLELQETVALKTIRPAIASSPAVIERFKSEVRQTRRITHPNVCRVYDLFSHVPPSGETIWFLTMELLDGPTLAESLAKGGPIPLKRALPLIKGMVAALSTAHDLGIVHRDFKPTNVMLVGVGAENERAVVTDFGLALSVDSVLAAGGTVAADGTPAYMAPEQATGATVGFAADQFALGLVICEMLTGKRPVLDRSSAQESRTQLKAWLSSPTGVHLIARTQRVMRRCLEFRQEDRFKHIREILPLLDGSRRRSRLRWAVGSAAAVAVFSGAIALSGTDWGDRVTEVLQLTPGTDLSGPPSLSGDGKWVAYGSDRADPSNLDVWVQPARGGSARRLTTNPADDVEPAISFDGKLVAFRSERDGGGIYIVQSDGSGERLLARGGRNPAFSPDGQWIAYWTGLRDDSSPSARLFLISPGGGPPKRVAADFADARYPVWNTKENLMLFEGCRQNASPLSACADWWAIRPVAGNAWDTGVLALLKAERIELPSPHTKAWRGDDLFISGIRSSLTTLWELNLPQKTTRIRGRPRQIRSTGGDERQPSVSANGRIAFGRVAGSLHVWRVPLLPRSETADPGRITNDAASDCCPSASHDGRWLFLTRKAGDFRQVVRKDLHSGEESVMSASDEDKFWPISNSNGERVAFETRARNESSIWLFDHGLKPRKLCAGCSHPTSWFAGDRGLFHATSNGKIALLDVQSEVSRPVLEGNAGVMLAGADWSPVHGYLLFTASENGGVKRLYTVLLSGGGEPMGSWVAITSGTESVDLPHWSGDGKSIFYFSKRDGHACIWAQRFDPIRGWASGKPEPIAHYHDPRASPERAGPLVRGLSVADNSIFLNVGEITEAIWSGVLRSPPLAPFLPRFLPN